ncbi:type II CRISPR RNA-guided endonuclease Cas9 [Holdemanella biformis]|uniref:type II CRISPR RNA-guided endonuclease Cas9 n=2 Tax=Holdemanella biformis TaxID=1735 RepID=UPI001C38AAF3|nr:type II CRISPR RNA-guided endonuclease Cas9 [Holdemanella biformis]MBV4130024.1 type II CRISPR RNA-guided endonuclease Cas9 [Holdemanella biformis]MBV4149769.1 type II CRISPR RNA-guided endonuclease Cas9 [Holdemanella biformis]
MDNKYVLGLDIGITSCGYGVINLETGKFVDYGVRLFKEGTAEENEKRRGARSRRRLTSRRHTRIMDMQKLLKENGIMSDDYHPLQNVYELRCKGLNEKLTNDELTAAILHITKHRGSVIETVEEDAKKSDDELSLKATLQHNEQLIKQGKYICQIQLDNLNDKDYIRGHENNFSTKDYVNELNEILHHQELDEQLIQKIIDIVARRRAYYEGPGSEKSPTPYGRFIEVDGQIKEIDLIEKMRGKCSVFPEELRAPKMAVTADLFNFLNDMNNLTVDGNKLSPEEKKGILTIVSQKGNITLRQLAKELNVDEVDIKGYRIDKNQKAIFTEFKGYKKIKSILEKEGYSISLNDYEMLDRIIEILTNKKGIQERKDYLYHLEYRLSDSVVDTLANTTGITGYHSLSFKALNLLNKELFESEMNQMQLLHELKLFDKNRVSHKGKKNIELDLEAILSPVAKRAQNETFKVVNALRKKYGEFDSIVVEMTRDKNLDEQKKRISNFQKIRENGSKEMDKMLIEKGYDPTKINGKTRMKIRLYEQQNGKSAYTLEPLDLNRVIKDPKYTEIDHIIPISISLDDSQNNKVLALHSENQVKGNLTPFMAYAANKFNGMGCSYPEFKTNVLSNKNIPYKKKLNLLNEENITKEEVAKKFINRNLVDTSYACRVVLNTLSDYFKDNEIDTKVHTINGRVTDLFRKKIHLEKDRDENYLHHAVDALIVASVKKMNLLNGYLAKQEHDFNDLYNEETGEIITIPDDKVFYDERYIQYIVNLKTLFEESSNYYNHVIDKGNMCFNPIKISHKVNTKPNRQIADETIYSTRNVDGTDYLIEKIPNIYDSKDKKCIRLVQDILNGEDEKYLMAKHDPQTFDLIRDIVKYHYEQFKSDSKMYKASKKKGEEIITLVGENPLTKYKEENGAVCKYSKKGNGPEIISMKYESEKLGNHLDISSNYQTNNKKVILKQIKPYRTDFYQCEDGKFRFVTVRYTNVSYHKAKGMYVIDEQWYKQEKANKKIKDTDKFLFSMHRDELIGIKKKEGNSYIYDLSTEKGGDKYYYDGNSVEVLKFTASNNETTGTIEVKPIYTYCKKQLMPTVASSLEIKKYATDVLGNLYEVKDNKLKLEFK